MTRRRPVWLAPALTAVLLLTWVVLVAVRASRGDLRLLTVWFEVVVNVIGFGLAGVVVTSRRPDNRIGLLFSSFAAVAAVQLSTGQWATVPPGDPAPAGGAWAALVSGAMAEQVLPLVFLILLLFPTGRPASRRLAVFPAAAVAVSVSLLVGAVLDNRSPNGFPTYHTPLGVPAAQGLAHFLIDDTGVLIPVMFLAALVTLGLRWRQADAAGRAQIKVFLLAAVLGAAVITVPAVVLGLLHVEAGWAGDVFFGLGVLLVPTGLATAVVRHRLYDIDRVVSRTVSYAVVTGVLVGVYVGCVALTTRTLPFSSAFGTAASTLVAAALFQPVRRRVQAVVDRRFNRARYDAARTIDEFAGRLRDEVDLDTVHHELALTVTRAIEPAQVSLWLRGTS